MSARDQRVELGDERGRLFRREIEAKDFDGDEPIAMLARLLVRAKDRTQRARTNLMENPERPECFGRKVQDGIFAVQRANGNINSVAHSGRSSDDFPGIKKLAADYAFHFSIARAVFFGRPRVAGVVEGGDRQRAAPSARSRRAERAYSSQPARASRRAEAGARAAARLADPNTVAIVTGQQAGLFGGPCSRSTKE